MDERQPENGGNQVDPQQRVGPPARRQSHQERETKLLGLDSDAIYLYLLGTFNSDVHKRTIRRYTERRSLRSQLIRLNRLREIWTRLGIYFVACRRIGKDGQATYQTDEKQRPKSDTPKRARTGKRTDRRTTQRKARYELLTMRTNSNWQDTTLVHPTHPHLLSWTRCLGSPASLWDAGYLLAMHSMGRKPGRPTTTRRTPA